MFKRTVLVESDDGPHRITGVSGPLLVGRSFPDQPGGKQRVEIQLDASAGRPGHATNLEIHTDSARQPVVSLSVLVLPTSEGENR